MLKIGPDDPAGPTRDQIFNNRMTMSRAVYDCLSAEDKQQLDRQVEASGKVSNPPEIQQKSAIE